MALYVYNLIKSSTYLWKNNKSIGFQPPVRETVISPLDKLIHFTI